MKYVSVCSGIEAASAAWHPLGFTPLAFSEIEPFPMAVLASHFPDVPNLGDLTKADFSQFKGQADILVGGTPCQSYSIAGMRKGLSDERGNLTLKFVEIADAIEPSFIVWENVPGVLSIQDNAFGCLLGGLAGCDGPLEPPGGRWTDAGYVSGPKRTIAWRVLDAQYFGLAQRRRRVFVVGCPREGADPAEILFEWESLRRDSPPVRKTRQNIASTLKNGSGSRGWDSSVEGTFIPIISGMPGIQGNHLFPNLANSLTANLGKCDNCTDFIPEIANPLTARAVESYRDGNDGNYIPEIANPLMARTSEHGESYGDGNFIPELANCLKASTGEHGETSINGNFIPQCAFPIITSQTSSNCLEIDENATHTPDYAQGIAMSFAQNQMGEVRVAQIIGTLNQNFNASGRNAPLLLYAPEIVPQAISCKWAKGASGPAGDEHHNLIAVEYPVFPYPINVREALIMAFHGSQDTIVNIQCMHAIGRNGGLDTCVAIPINTQIATRDKALGEKTGLGVGTEGDPAYTLGANHHHAVACQQNPVSATLCSSGAGLTRPAGQASETDFLVLATQQGGAELYKNLSPAITASAGESGNNQPVLFNPGIFPNNLNINQHDIDNSRTRLMVRRLTPTECETLQGFPVGWTNIEYRGKPASDAPRYKALGNSMAVNVMAWIGKRIAMVAGFKNQEKCGQILKKNISLNVLEKDIFQKEDSNTESEAECVP